MMNNQRKSSDYFYQMSSRRIKTVSKKVFMALSVLGLIGLFLLQPIEVCAATEWVTVDGIENGQVKFNTSTGVITETTENITVAIIPSEINGVTVTGIAYGAFRNLSLLTEVEIPDGITTIEERAFSGCTALTTIAIPESVTIIKDSAFNGCTSLIDLVIPSGVTYIGEAAFMYCRSLESIEIPVNVSTIRRSTFVGCTALKSIELPDSIVEM